MSNLGHVRLSNGWIVLELEKGLVYGPAGLESLRGLELGKLTYNQT